MLHGIALAGVDHRREKVRGRLARAGACGGEGSLDAPGLQLGKLARQAFAARGHAQEALTAVVKSVAHEAADVGRAPQAADRPPGKGQPFPMR